MYVVVTLAGHSRRFAAAGHKLPKALIDVDGRPMIAHVVEMFAPSDRFIFIVNSDQVKEYPQLIDVLRGLSREAEIVTIAPHERGPVVSALAVKSIPDDEEVIVTYCDFFVDWDYAAFLRRVKGSAAAMVTFRGFHPASYGDTLYAYVRTDGNKLLEVREKKSFTSDRISEHASVGIYYFSSWDLFRKHAEAFLGEPPAGLEAYVSLLYNRIAQEFPGEVVIDEARRFICLGTPEDLEHYRFWANYFHQILSAQKLLGHRGAGSGQVNLIPMAGQGRRFRDAGYRVAKPLIKVLNAPMVVSAVNTFPAADHWVFEVLGLEMDKHPIEKALKQFDPEAEVLRVETPTSGQAATCLLAKKSIQPKSPLFIASCDYQTFYDEDRWQEIIADDTIDGAIWTCRMKSIKIKNPQAFAYCRVGLDGRTVTEVVEKKTISAHPEEDPLVVGSFWYRRGADFIRGAEKMIDLNIQVNGEHYVGTSINQLIKEGARFVVFDVNQWISFGDPFELKIFEYWQDHFAERDLEANPSL